MKRKKLVRFELLILAVVTLLLAYRVAEGPPSPAGVVVMDDFERDDLRRESFSTDTPVRVSIDAVGSFETADDTSLAAYGWLLRRQDRKVVWRLDPTTARREGETLAASSDTVDLAPGIYDAYFTSYGSRRNGGFSFRFLDRLFGNDASWKGESGDWRFIVRAADGGEDHIRSVDTKSEAELSPGGHGLFWSTSPMKGHRRAEHIFLATEKVPVRIYAVGEIDDDEPMDFGWIENAVSGARTWEMTLANTTPAGGWHVNRLFRDSIFVEEGIHRAVFRTDARQNFGDWVANPPYDPAAWGLSLFTSKPDAIREYDPWTSRTPVIQIKEVGDDARHTAQFRVVQPVQLAAWAVGEMSSSSRYDYAWIRNNDTQETLWEMTVERSSPAGGDNNYRELAFLDLAEGTYTLTYQTDDSHSFESWRHGRPDHPERWGVSLFPVAADFDTSAVQVLDYSEESLDGDESDLAAAPPAPPPHPDLPDLPGQTVVDLTALGNQQQVSKEFVLEQPATLHIRALGEVSLSGRYDYGWIERTDTGEIIWEMSWQNTRAAGGDDINRLFDGTLTLEPGTYVAHFKTDFSHAYGDFGEREPSMSQAWGIQISKL